MDVEFLDISEYRTWSSRISATDLANIDRRIMLLREHGVAFGMPNVRRIDVQERAR